MKTQRSGRSYTAQDWQRQQVILMCLIMVLFFIVDYDSINVEDDCV